MAICVEGWVELSTSGDSLNLLWTFSHLAAEKRRIGLGLNRTWNRKRKRYSWTIVWRGR
jgi:hypothetical protein